MRKDGKYRFTLQFSADNEDQIRVGELLENLGNRKSTVIISALSDYIDTHPELQSGYSCSCLRPQSNGTVDTEHRGGETI